MRTTLLFLFLVLFFGCTDPAPEEDAGPPNVLLIMVDDLRPELGSYGHDLVQSPHIDKLAAGGIVFTEAHCNFASCGASRASMLTGLRPTRNRFTTYDAFAEKEAPDAEVLPARFQRAGYRTISNGKIFHHKKDHQYTWDQLWRPTSPGRGQDYLTQENIDIVATGVRGWPWERAEVADTAYFDGQVAEQTVLDLRQLKESGEPFFLSAGFYKPHLPFNAPEKYWRPYDGKVELPDNDFAPENAPKESLHNYGELRHYYGMQGDLADSTVRQLIQGYYASVSYTDAQVGRVLDELEALDLADNTIVILVGDHGYNLWEHRLWCKHSNYRTSLRTALIVRDPRIGVSGSTKGLVELVDIYPSLLELTGLEAPTTHPLAGKSFAHQLRDPSVEGKPFVIGKFRKGITVKVPDMAYTEYLENDSSLVRQARMLYDHRSDLAENINIAEQPENEVTVDSLSVMLRRNWGVDF